MTHQHIETANKKPRKSQPKLLVVDAERGGSHLLSEASAAKLDCRIVTAKSIVEARRILATETVALLLTDMKLPDGRGLALIPELRKNSPHAAVVVTARGAKLEDALDAFRNGVSDFIPRPCTQEQLAERVQTALANQDRFARGDRKIERLRGAVRKLSAARKTVAKKVDLLCNDLVGAYGELSRQVDSVRTAEDFRKLCDATKDLEQLLCHAMDWIMRRVGFSNIAVFLATDEQGDNPDATTGFQLGAYVKYTLASSPEMIEALKEGMLRRASREGFVRMTAEESEKSLTAGELRHLRGQALVAANCTYLGESLATVILFRDGASPFTTDDADTFRAIAPIFAIALAGQVRGGGQTSHGDNGEHENNGADGTPPRKDERADADWWKRGEAPPY